MKNKIKLFKSRRHFYNIELPKKYNVCIVTSCEGQEDTIEFIQMSQQEYNNFYIEYMTAKEKANIGMVVRRDNNNILVEIEY